MMITTKELCVDRFTSDKTLRKKIQGLARGIARELDNINQGALHLARFRTLPSMKSSYNELSELYMKVVKDCDVLQLIQKVPRLRLVVPVSDITISIVINGMIILDISAVRPHIDFYADHDDNLDLPFEFHVDRYSLTLIDDRFKLESQGIIFGDSLVYYHPFLRRFFGARFVDTPDILANIKKQGKVSLQIAFDPIRYTDASLLDATMEMDYWYGAYFSKEKLNNVRLFTDVMIRRVCLISRSH